MKTISYESLRAEQAWKIIADQLDQRNTLLSQAIRQLEQGASQIPTVSRLVMLRYHLRYSLRQLTAQARRQPAPTRLAELSHRQWMHIRQLALLLTQIDHELAATRQTDRSFRSWVRSRPDTKPIALRVHAN